MHSLTMKNVTLRFGGLVAINNLSFDVEAGSITSIIGPNGAGKTSVFNLLTGFYQPNKGKIELNGVCLNNKKPSEITRLGLARTFQNLRLFPNLTVLDNVKAGMHCRTKQKVLGALLHTRAQREEEHLIEATAMDCLSFVGIEQYAHRIAKHLPYGTQRYLEIARALATKPQVLLLDEPAAGLNYEEKENLIQLIRRIQATYRVTVLIIEHDMALIKKVAENLIVLDYGEKIAEGAPDQVLNDPRVVEAYLGKEEAV
ncbi:ABC transporter ATP-binding protein [Brevibacillus ginsengisoli]|uniref:ABC transporter ATP-binding protein n=1 Tax=Brevibacillus ginsengisoli TaxID=363854 RepID=UPI003CE6E5B7